MENCFTDMRYNPFTRKKSKIILTSPSERFWVKANSVPECDGHMLLFSELPIFSMAELNKNDYEEMSDLEKRVVEIVSSIYKEQAVVFEHGSGFDGEKTRAASCVKAAHRQIVFIKDEVIERMLHECNWGNIQGHDDIKNFAENPYIWFRDKDGVERITLDIIERQYGLKRVIAKDDKYRINDLGTTWQNRIALDDTAIPKYMELEQKNIDAIIKYLEEQSK
jgi:hypothetical protein